MNMTCANRNCKAELKYLRGGQLFLMEREPHIPSQAAPGSAEPKRHVTMRRYFWLCASCAQDFLIRRWTEDGIELVPRHTPKYSPQSAKISHGWTMPGLVG